MSAGKKGVFVAWRIFQRRNTSLAREFNLETLHYHRKWEEKSKIHKLASYILKSIEMLRDLVNRKPQIVFLQLPPVPVLYIVALYSRMSGCRYVADCHNIMLQGKWLDWPFAKALLNRADVLLFHNQDVAASAQELGLNAVTLRDPLPDIPRTNNPGLLEKYGLNNSNYVIVPWSFASDEPIAELFQAAESLPETKFVMTWFAEKLPLALRNSIPLNVVLTGYLEHSDFNAIFSEAGAALVLTTREGTQPSAASEAISLGVPLIISDLQTTRKLYNDVPIYVQNTARAIHSGVARAFDERSARVMAIRAFAKAYSNDINAEIVNIKCLLGA